MTHSALVPNGAAAVGTDRVPFALWEITATESGEEVVTFFAVTDSPAELPHVHKAYRATHGASGAELRSVHSVQRVTRIRSELESGRFWPGLLVTDVISDQRAGVVTPADLGLS